ncbi:WD40 repeat-like protein [Durotheca rogersii]|uniref:WD40 repeat-like protein n=1 Tax=Durotheca rogersii TaxID=419775 RepID=UPI00221F9A57|nr:WD40 repeat-like protein [Durotheca rogersii]KAI5862890.1 WD40 repeat-like protein [Durotheca rogersii]
MAFPDKPIAHLLGSNGPVHALAYSASPGTYILAGSADRSVRLYNPQPSSDAAVAGAKLSSHITKKSSGSGAVAVAVAVPEGRLIQAYSAHGYEVLSLSVAADNARFASAGGDRAVFLWDVTTAQTVRRFGSGGGPGAHQARVNCVAFAGDGDSLLVSGSVDRSVRVWDLRAGGGPGAKPVQVLDDARDAVSAVAVRGPEIVAASVDGRVRSYDVRAGRRLTDVVGPPVTSLCLTRDGRAALVGALDSRLRLMDRDTGACLRTYTDPAWRNEDLRLQSLLGAKEQYVLAGDEMTAPADPAAPPARNGEGRIWAWDVLSGELKAKVAVPWGPAGYEPKKFVGKDGKPKNRSNVLSCFAWRENGFGDQFCVSGTSGIVTVFGYH